MKDLFLVDPSEKYRKSFEDYILAYRRINDKHYFIKYRKALENFREYLNELYDYYTGKNLPEGEVATSTFWLIYEKTVVGVLRIRHQEIECAGHIGYDISPDHRNRGYGSQILKLALEKAKEMGMYEVILTCEINNIASRKIIEKNNGKLLGTFFEKEENEHMYRYSIELTGE